MPLALLTAFVGLYYVGVPANLLSMGAIDFGILLDGAVILVPKDQVLRTESFKISVLIGPMQGRNEEILKHTAKLIGLGEWRFNPSNGMIEMEKDGRIKLLENGTFQGLI